MSLDIITIPCLTDNYAYLVHDQKSGQTALVDAPETQPILDALAARGWTLSHIFLTHHHWDHVDAVEPLRVKFNPIVVGAAADNHRLPRLDLSLADGQCFPFAGQSVLTFDVSGHTIGHIAFHFPEEKIIFTADSLMALGCGRLFEGTPEQMHQSLSKIAKLPPETMVYSGHEYTLSNAKFAIAIDPDNTALQTRIASIEATRSQNKPTVPSALSLELATNPFLRCHTTGVKTAVGMPDATTEAVFTEVRKRKDNF